MATSGARKEPASASKQDGQSSEPKPQPGDKGNNTYNGMPMRGLLDPAVLDSVFTEKEKKPIKSIKLKKAVPKQTKPGNWKESETIEPNKKSDAPPSGPESPLVNPVDDIIAAAFPTGRPLEDKPELVMCKHCKRPVLRIGSEAHFKRCLEKKQAKVQRKKEAKEAKEAAARKEKGLDDDADDKPKNARKSALKGADDEGGAKKGKKRKADADPEKAPNAKKKKKDEPKVKAPKPKQPVDVERQCGVPLSNGQLCARSLTCKSHSMGAKRAVPGRSLPYDMLLAQYQKKNQAKQQRAAIDANAPLPDDFDTHGPVDSDEEKDAVMAAIARARPRPLATRPFISARAKYQYIRMKEMLHSALGGSRGAGLFSVGPPAEGGHRGFLGGGDGGHGPGGFPMNGGLNSAGPDAPPGFEGHSRRSSTVGGPRQILPGQLPPPSRKPSVSSIAAGGPM